MLQLNATAATIEDFSQKQGFLNTVYEQFFQGFSVEIADTHGIVYTPQPIVDFMVKSVDQILKTEFNRSLSDSGVHIIESVCGDGQFYRADGARDSQNCADGKNTRQSYTATR